MHILPFWVASMPAVRFDLSGGVRKCLWFFMYQEYNVICISFLWISFKPDMLRVYNYVNNFEVWVWIHSVTKHVISPPSPLRPESTDTHNTTHTHFCSTWTQWILTVYQFIVVTIWFHRNDTHNVHEPIGTFPWQHNVLYIFTKKKTCYVFHVLLCMFSYLVRLLCVSIDIPQTWFNSVFNVIYVSPIFSIVEFHGCLWKGSMALLCSPWYHDANHTNTESTSSHKTRNLHCTFHSSAESAKDSSNNKLLTCKWLM